MCICFSESASRLAFSWTPHRVSGNKYGNLSMRAKLLSSCFCLLHSLVKYHFSINSVIANSKIGAFATGNYLLQHDHSENILLIKIKHFQFVQYLSPGPPIRGEIGERVLGPRCQRGPMEASNNHVRSISNDNWVLFWTKSGDNDYHNRFRFNILWFCKQGDIYVFF